MILTCPSVSFQGRPIVLLTIGSLRGWHRRLCLRPGRITPQRSRQVANLAARRAITQREQRLGASDTSTAGWLSVGKWQEVSDPAGLHLRDSLMQDIEIVEKTWKPATAPSTDQSETWLLTGAPRRSVGGRGTGRSDWARIDGRLHDLEPRAPMGGKTAAITSSRAIRSRLNRFSGTRYIFSKIACLSSDATTWTRG